jgi:hypothetical protein
MTDDLEPDAPTDLDRQVKDAALGAVRILGREVRALRARLAEAEKR